MRSDQQPAPRQGDVIQCGPIKLKVGPHNGDFRYISFEDHLGRPLGQWSVPYRALREIEEAGLIINHAIRNETSCDA